VPAEVLVTSTARPPRPSPVRRPVRRRRWLLAFLLVSALAVAGITTPLWGPLVGPDPWRVVYDGYGSVHHSAGQVSLRPEPPASADPADTHAALVVSRESYGDLTFEVRVRTAEQLRPGGANPWEVGWVLWHVTDPQHFYAITLKPNGWELSRQTPGAPGGQQFLASGSTPTFPVGTWHDVQVTQRGGHITVTADGRPLVDHVDDEPYTHGGVGLYTEDADVSFRDIAITPLTQE
jgi:hypothetical protein